MPIKRILAFTLVLLVMSVQTNRAADTADSSNYIDSADVPQLAWIGVRALLIGHAWRQANPSVLNSDNRFRSRDRCFRDSPRCPHFPDQVGIADALSFESMKIQMLADLILVASVLPVAAQSTLCPHMAREFRRDAFQYPKPTQDAILKAARDLDTALRTTIKPPFGYMVCAGTADGILHPQFEVWTDRDRDNSDCSENRWGPIPKIFEDQPVMVYCKGDGKFQ
jgi:hypothetical protein